MLDFLEVVGHRLISARARCERVALELRDSGSVGISAAPLADDQMTLLPGVFLVREGATGHGH